MHELTGTPIKQSDEGFTAGPTGSCDTPWQTQLTEFTSRFNTLNTNATSGTSANLSSIKDQYVKLHDDITKTLGLSLVPLTGNVPLRIWSSTENAVKEVEGNAMLFRDSQPHGVPFTKDARITIRIFGDIDFNDLDDYIDLNTITR
jgi:hypothetical protein